jgi:small subunit ribosomal protein S8
MVDIMVDRFAEAINTIKNNEYIGREECVVYSTKLVKRLIDIMRENGYVDGYEEFDDRHAKRIRIRLSKRINNIGVVKPRHAIKRSTIIDYEQRYIPSKDFGILVISTPSGIITNREARERGTGGRLLAYMY